MEWLTVFRQIMSEKKFRPFDWNQNSDEEIKEYDLSKVRLSFLVLLVLGK